MKSCTSGSLVDGLSIVMTFCAMISLTNSLPTTGSRTIPRKLQLQIILHYSLQSKLLLKVARALFDNQRSHFKSHHEGFAGGVKTSENGQFLYKSTQADSLLRSRGAMDYFMIFAASGWLAGVSSLLLVPFLVATLSLPRKLAIINYFTFHAELLPHTEQVVFHKGDFFGNVKRIIVDIKNLEKIDADVVPSKMLWAVNMFD